MNVAILGGDEGWHTEDLNRALGKKGHGSCTLPINALTARVGDLPHLAVGDTALEELDAVLLRIIPKGSLEQIIFRVDALHGLERLGVCVLNPPGVVERTVDKFYTSALLEEAGLKTPRVVVTERLDEAMAAFQMMGDVVVKPLFGSGGRGIVRVSDPEIAYRVFHALELERAVYYVQQALPHDGRDLRVFVVGTRVIAAIWRSAKTWRTNLARGARAEPAELPHAWADLGVAAARAVGAEYAGVDLLPTATGELYVVEVNGIPGWRGLHQATGVDVAGAIVQHLENRVRNRGEPGGLSTTP